jgi:hypothetical protein
VADVHVLLQSLAAGPPARNSCCVLIAHCLHGPSYGNLLEALPEPALGLPSLRDLWLESNPLGDAGRLRPSNAEHRLALGPRLRSVGLDQWQASHNVCRRRKCDAAIH